MTIERTDNGFERIAVFEGVVNAGRLELQGASRPERLPGREVAEPRNEFGRQPLAVREDFEVGLDEQRLLKRWNRDGAGQSHERAAQR